MTKWKEIWEKRDTSNLDHYGIHLQDLIRADGFDSGAGNVDLDSWKLYITFISDKIYLEMEDSVFEVGCGSGAFLYMWYLQSHVVGGIDYSPSLITLAQNAMNGQDFALAEANQLDINNKYDIVISNSVFSYFENYVYALDVLEKMASKARKTIVILDIPDSALQVDSERARMEALSPQEYKRKYTDLSHLYYDKKWFVHFAENHKYTIEIFDQNIQNYGNSQFRFNVVLKK